MKTWGALLGAVVVVLAIAGCSAQGASAPAATSAARQAAPEASSSVPADPNAEYLAAVRLLLVGDFTYADDDLLQRGEGACYRLDAGVDKSEIKVLSDGGGPSSIANSVMIVDQASKYLCPS